MGVPIEVKTFIPKNKKKEYKKLKEKKKITKRMKKSEKIQR